MWGPPWMMQYMMMPEPPVIISFHYINLYLYITYNLIQMFFILYKTRWKPSLKKKHEVFISNPITVRMDGFKLEGG